LDRQQAAIHYSTIGGIVNIKSNISNDNILRRKFMLKMKIQKTQANKLFVIQFQKPFGDGEWTEDNFQNSIYQIQSKLVNGSQTSLVSGKNNEYEINIGQEFIWTISEALFKQMSSIEGKAKVAVVMAVSGTTTEWRVNEVNDDTNLEELKVFDPSTDTSHNVEHKPENGVDRDIAIKWGMAFNNATRIAASEEGKPKDKVAIIKDLMPEMMMIATGLDEYLKSLNPSDDDLPF